MGLKPRPPAVDAGALNRFRGLVESESLARAEDFARVCLARTAGRPELLPPRPPSARECRRCRGTGNARGDSWRIAIEGGHVLCGDCMGRGWLRNPFLEHPGPLTEVFRRSWCESGFSDELVADPRGVLAANGLELPASVEIGVETNRHRDWCPYCQLSYARVEITCGSGDPGPWADVPDNVIVTVGHGQPARLQLVVGHHRHICCCGERDLDDLVVA